MICGRNCAEKMEEEAPEEDKVEEARKGAYEGRGEPLAWRIAKQEKHINLENGVKIAGR